MDMKNRQLGLYVDETTLELIQKAASALNMNRSEFIRYCILHVLDESNALRSRLKEGFLASKERKGAVEK